MAFRLRGILGALTALACCVGLARAQSPSSPIPVRFTVQTASLVTTLIEIAIEQKFFEKVGLNVTTSTVAHGPAAVTALASGSVDIATNAPEVFLALASKGLSLKLIGGGSKQLGVLVARPGLDLPAEFPANVSALKGKKIGVTALSSATQYLAIAMLSAAGLSASDVQFVAVGATPAAALVNGVIDAGFVTGPQVVVSQGLGSKIIVDLRLAEKCAGKLDICGIGQVGMWAMTDWIEKNPEAVARVRRAIAMADRFVHDPANAAAVRTTLLKHIPADSPEAMKKDYVAYGLSVLSAAFARSDLEKWIVIDHSAGVIPAVFPVANVFAEGTPDSVAAVEAQAK